MNEDPSQQDSLASPAGRSGPSDQLANLAAPLAKMGLEAVQDVAAVLRSTRTAGRDVWRLVNVVDRVRHAEWSGSAEDATTDVTPAEATGEAPDKAPSGPLPAKRAPFVRIADAAVGPTARLGSAGGARLRGMVTPVQRMVADTFGSSPEVGDREEDLREVAHELIKRSWEPDAVFARRHPAFAEILTELTPDEARVLRFLAVAGPQPSIDIRTKTLFGIGSERIAYGINMIAQMAGCRWPEFSENYLANLNRLGLVQFSKEPVEDYRRYSLLEVQPDAVDAIEAAGRSTISVYRSIHLTAFGHQFCDVCIDTDGYDAGGWAVNERGDRIVRFGWSTREV
jgi:hypothetical protein